MYNLRKATYDDLPEMQKIFAHARQYMRETGNPTQWSDNRPPLFLIERDLDRGVAYMVYDDDELVGTFSFTLGEEPTYKVIDGAWLNDKPYGTIHRIASNGTHKGMFEFCLTFCQTFGVDIRIDTHSDNSTMRHLFDKYNFKYCGIIIIDDMTPRLAYHLPF